MRQEKVMVWFGWSAERRSAQTGFCRLRSDAPRSKKHKMRSVLNQPYEQKTGGKLPPVEFEIYNFTD